MPLPIPATGQPAAASCAPPGVAATADAPSPARWFTDEVHAHDSQLKAYLRSAFPAVRSEVDDVVQESYLRIWKARAAQPIKSAKAFLFTIARHLALDTLRKGKNFPLETGCDSAVLRVLDPNPDAAQTLLTDDLFDHVVEVLVALPERYRNVIVLHKLQGLSHAEIAVRLNLTERTAQKYCSVGLELCAARLGGKGIHNFFQSR